MKKIEKAEDSFESDSFAGLPIEASDYTILGRNHTALRFGRFEFKYVIADSKRTTFEDVLTKFMEVDPHCSDSSDVAYNVSSVYFDTRTLDCYHHKQDGLLNRRKFRIRSYGSGPCFLEEKGRRNAYSYKKRAPLADSLASAAFKTNWAFLISAGDDPPIDPIPAFVVAGLRAGLSPKVRVTYRRRAYVAKGGYRFRVTLDDQIAGATVDDLFGKATRTRSALPGHTVVEIKFAQRVPLWFTRLIESAQLTRLSISKYCVCAEALGLVMPDEPALNIRQQNFRS